MNERQFLKHSKKTMVSEGPRFPPYSGPYDIPVLIDSVKALDDFQMTRCLFFTIDAPDVFDDWVGMRRGPDTPFLLFGFVPVIHRPHASQDRFNNSRQIDDFFDRFESTSGLMVETAHVWLPTFLLEAVPAEVGQERGAVWRVSYELFKLALQFQQELIEIDSFLEGCRSLRETNDNVTEYSSEETIAFQSWNEQQIEAAQENYARQREDPDLEVLPWIDEAGFEQQG